MNFRLDCVQNNKDVMAETLRNTEVLERKEVEGVLYNI